MTRSNCRKLGNKKTLAMIVMIVNHTSSKHRQRHRSGMTNFASHKVSSCGKVALVKKLRITVHLFLASQVVDRFSGLEYN